jgi:dipeptide/tripeptide permease
MNTPSFRSAPSVLAVRWTARTLSLVLVALLVLIAVGESWNSPIPWARLSALELAMFAALGLALFGLLAAWRWERAGALASIAGTTLFTLGLIARKGLHFQFFWIEGALAAFGLMFLYCSWSDRRRPAALSHP